jgi:hypothetical protein
MPATLMPVGAGHARDRMPVGPGHTRDRTPVGAGHARDNIAADMSTAVGTAVATRAPWP